MQKKLCFLCLKPNHSAKNFDKTFTCFKCQGKHHVGICTYTPKESDKNNDSKSNKNNKKVNPDDDKTKFEEKTQKDDKNFLNAPIATLNLWQQNSVPLEIAQARVESPDGKRSKVLRILFDNGSQIFFITPKAKKLLNLGAKGSNKYSIKPFGNNEIKKELENVDIVINTLNHEKILINTLVCEICLPINSQKISFCKQNYKHWSNLNFGDNNTENKALKIHVLIGGDYYWDFVCDEVVRGESGPIALLKKLGYVLSGPIERKKNQSNKDVNIIHSHVMRMHCESKPELIDTKSFWNNEKIDTGNLKNDVIKNSVDSVVKNEFNDNEKFENHIFKSF